MSTFRVRVNPVNPGMEPGDQRRTGGSQPRRARRTRREISPRGASRMQCRTNWHPVVFLGLRLHLPCSFAFSVVRSSPRRSSRGGSCSLFPMIWLSRKKLQPVPDFLARRLWSLAARRRPFGRTERPGFPFAFRIFFPGLHGSGGSVESFASIERTLVISWVGERGRPTPLSVPTRGMRLQDYRLPDEPPENLVC